MAAFLNLCRFVPVASGTADWTYLNAVGGCQSPAAAGAVNGKPYKVYAVSNDLTQWETSEGAYNSGTGVFARTSVLSNSSGTGLSAGQTGAGTKISFSTVPQVSIVALADDLPSLNESNTFGATNTFGAGGTGTLPTVLNGNGASGAGAGFAHQFRKNGTINWWTGHGSAITGSGTSSDLLFWNAALAAAAITISYTDNLVTIAGNVTLARSSPTIILNASDDNGFIQFKNSGAMRWYFYSTLGSLYLYNGASSAGVQLTGQSATSWSAVSDRRVKAEIKTLSVLDRLDKFRAVTYLNTLTSTREIGVIAQDEIARAPEFVHRGYGSDDDKITSMEDPRKWSVIYDRYGVEALQGVKELLALVLQLRGEIEALKLKV